MFNDESYTLTDMKNSVDYMLSDDWKQRFIAEYAQLVTRIEKIIDVVWYEESIDNAVKCPFGLLDLQVDKMTEYKQILEIRADIYGIDLEAEVNKLNS